MTLQWWPSNWNPHGSLADGSPKDADPVKELTELLRQAGHFGERFVEPHGVARGLVGARADTRAQHAVGKLALLVGKLGHAKAVTHQIAVDVAPGPPDFAVDREAHGRALRGVERGEECLCRIDQRLGRDAGLAERKQPARDLARRGDALERFLQRDAPAREQILQRLRDLGLVDPWRRPARAMMSRRLRSSLASIAPNAARTQCCPRAARLYDVADDVLYCQKITREEFVKLVLFQTSPDRPRCCPVCMTERGIVDISAAVRKSYTPQLTMQGIIDDFDDIAPRAR